MTTGRPTGARGEPSILRAHVELDAGATVHLEVAEDVADRLSHRLLADLFAVGLHVPEPAGPPDGHAFPRLTLEGDARFLVGAYGYVSVSEHRMSMGSDVAGSGSSVAMSMRADTGREYFRDRAAGDAPGSVSRSSPGPRPRRPRRSDPASSPVACRRDPNTPRSRRKT